MRLCLFLFGVFIFLFFFFFFSSRRRHTRCGRDWSSDVCSSDLMSHLRLASYFLFQQEIDRAKHHAEVAYDLSFKKQLYRDKLASLKLLSEIDTLDRKSVV